MFLLNVYKFGLVIFVDEKNRKDIYFRQKEPYKKLDIATEVQRERFIREVLIAHSYKPVIKQLDIPNLWSKCGEGYKVIHYNTQVNVFKIGLWPKVEFHTNNEKVLNGVATTSDALIKKRSIDSLSYANGEFGRSGSPPALPKVTIVYHVSASGIFVDGKLTKLDCIDGY